MKAFLASLAPQLLDILAPVLVAALGWVFVRLAAYIKAHTKNARVQGILLRLNDATFTAVSSLEQTVVTAAKESTSDGRLTVRSGEVVKAAAMAAIKSHLGPQGIGELKAILGVQDADLDSFLSSRIESSVLHMPVSIDTVVAPLAVPQVQGPRGQDPDSVNTPAKPVAIDHTEDITGNFKK
jgi:hypothetical protein